MAQKTEPNYLRAALLMPGNWVAILASGAASALSGDPTALLVALGLEGLFVGLLSSSRRFRRAVRARELSSNGDELEELEESKQLLGELSESQQAHYRSLAELRAQILVNYGRLPGGRVLVASSEARLSKLLTSFVRLLATLNAYRRFLGSADQTRLAAELTQLEAEVREEGNARVREVKEKRVEILRKRWERFQQAKESREVVSHQLAAIEDLLRLTHEQSISIRDPDLASQQLASLANESSASDETVQEMKRFLELSDELPPVPQAQRVR